MLPATEATKKINAFVDARIPSARDLYARYGERINANGIYTTDGEAITEPLRVGSSTIGDMITAERLAKQAAAKQEETPEDE